MSEFGQKPLFFQPLHLPNTIARSVVWLAALRVGTWMMAFLLSSPVDRP
ncbi:hypothetical protein QUA32_03015 [Microcoleus sp. Pol14D6]